MTPDRDIDAIGLICPLPVLRAAKALREMDMGQVLRLRADDPVAVIDIPHFCAETGQTLLGQSDEDGVQVYLIRKDH